MKWNERERQKSFVVIEEDPAVSSSSGVGPLGQSASNSIVVPDQSKQDDFDEDEVEEYDIDDVAPSVSLPQGLGPFNHDGQLNPDEGPFPRRRVHSNLDHNVPSDRSSQGASTLKNSTPSPTSNHARLPTRIGNPNPKAFAVWGLDASSSSDGSLSDS